MLLSDRDIRAEIDAGRVSLDPWDPAMIQPSSVDVRLDKFFRLFDNHKYQVIDPAQDQADLTRLVEVDPQEGFVLHPGEFVLGSTLETVSLPDDLAARVEGKSSLGRLGLLTHATAGFVDPGFTGHVTLELSNVATLPIMLWPGMKIGQLAFFRLSSAPPRTRTARRGTGRTTRASAGRRPAGASRTSTAPTSEPMTGTGDGSRRRACRPRPDGPRPSVRGIGAEHPVTHSPEALTRSRDRHGGRHPDARPPAEHPPTGCARPGAGLGRPRSSTPTRARGAAALLSPRGRRWRRAARPRPRRARRASSSSCTVAPSTGPPPGDLGRSRRAADAALRGRRCGTAAGGRLAVVRLKNRVKGWNGIEQDPVQDARWALERIRRILPGAPVALVGHSMGGRVALQLAADPDVAPSPPSPRGSRGMPGSPGPGVPVLLMHGTGDRMTDPRRTAVIARRWEASGVDVTYVPVKGERHAMLRRASYWHRAVADFVTEALPGAGRTS